MTAELTQPPGSARTPDHNLPKLSARADQAQRLGHAKPFSGAMANMHDNENELMNGASISEALHRAAARVDGNLDQRLAALGLTSRQYLLLKSVAPHDGISQMGLTDLTGIDRSTMTDMVGRLISRGLLSRTKNPRDARAYIVRITESGRQQMALAMPMVTQIDDVVLSGIGPAPRQSFLQTLEAICTAPETSVVRLAEDRALVAATGSEL